LRTLVSLMLAGSTVFGAIYATSPRALAQAVTANSERPDVESAGAGASNVDGDPSPNDTSAVVPTTSEGTKPEGGAQATQDIEENPDPVIVILREKLAAVPEPRDDGERDDWAALRTYYTKANVRPVWVQEKGFTERAKQAIAEIGKADDWGLKAAEFELPELKETSPSREALAQAEQKLAAAVLKYVRYARGGRLRPSSISSLFDQDPEVADPVAVLNAIAAADAADVYLRDQHPKHPQFELLRKALIDARKSTAAAKGEATKLRKASSASVHQILANMERWRWMPRYLGNFYVWDDVPGQMTRLVKDEKVVLQEKIVVGKPSTPTPIFSANMLYVIFHPSWGVPPGMKTGELWPQLRNSGGGWFSMKPLASSVLRAHGLRVSRGGTPVDPDSVDWSSVNINNYQFTQAPGPTNVLGIVKFRFPNKHNVYMHDTPERHLFGGGERAFSHGCMRVQNPIRLAEQLLEHDKGWDSGDVRRALHRGESIELTTPVPVHVTYFTVEVDEDGKLITRRDIYGLDRRVASAVEGAPIHMGSGVRSASKKSKRNYLRNKKRYQRTTSNKPKPFNPFRNVFGD
jgi:L,D-transpeptidase YcbB